MRSSFHSVPCLSSVGSSEEVGLEFSAVHIAQGNVGAGAGVTVGYLAVQVVTGAIRNAVRFAATVREVPGLAG